MSNKSKKRKAKKAKVRKAKAQVVSVIKLDANKHVAIVEVEGAKDLPKEISTWTSFVNWVKAYW